MNLYIFNFLGEIQILTNQSKQFFLKFVMIFQTEFPFQCKKIKTKNCLKENFVNVFKFWKPIVKYWFYSKHNLQFIEFQFWSFCSNILIKHHFLFICNNWRLVILSSHISRVFCVNDCVVLNVSIYIKIVLSASFLTDKINLTKCTYKRSNLISLIYNLSIISYSYHLYWLLITYVITEYELPN